MINIFKNIEPMFISIKPFKLYKTYNFDQTNIGSGSSNILIFDAINDKSSSSEVTDLYRPPNNPFIKDSAGYILDYNYTLGNGEKYMPISESLNPNGSVKRLIYKSIKRLFYDPDSVYYEKYFSNINHSANPLGDKAFLFYIPSKYISEAIGFETFVLIDTSDTSNQPYGNSNPEGIKITDTYGDGHIYDENNPNITFPIGNISYDTGHIIVLDEQYRNYFVKNLMETASNANLTISFASYYTTTEYEYVCVAAADEFNLSSNPTLYSEISGSKSGTGPIKTELVSQPWFRTYITQIGLYDDAGKLVVVGKFAKPLRKEKTFDSIFIVKFDI
jgi:hypothetical protein